MNIKDKEIVAILRDVSEKYAVEIVRELIKHEIYSVEVSLKSETEALNVIKLLKDNFGEEIHLGAGTVLTKEQVDKASQAGASFILTPGWDEEIVDYCIEKKIDILPGVFTPGEISKGIKRGLKSFKLFPASTLGTDFVKNIFGPFKDINIVAVGGVTKDNITEFYKVGCKSFAIGNDLVKRNATLDDIPEIKEKAIFYNTILKENE